MQTLRSIVLLASGADQRLHIAGHAQAAEHEIDVAVSVYAMSGPVLIQLHKAGMHASVLLSTTNSSSCRRVSQHC